MANLRMVVFVKLTTSHSNEYCLASMSLNTVIGFVTGGGTLALAAVTSWMAYETRKLSQSSKESIDLSQDELDELKSQTEASRLQANAAQLSLVRSSLPILVPRVSSDVELISEKALLRSAVARGEVGETMTIRDYDGTMLEWPTSWQGSRVAEPNTDGSVWLVIEMKNIGTGPALVESRVVSVDDDSLGGKAGCALLPDLFSLRISHLLKAQTAVIPAQGSTFFVKRLMDQARWNSFFAEIGAKRIIFDTRFNYRGLLSDKIYTTWVDFILSDQSGHLIALPPKFTGFDL
jgi:hypothetical protein